MSENRLNAYRIMWLLVFFDLPTNTKSERKSAARFRKDLLEDGFIMMQYSVYCRHCASFEHGEVHKKRLSRMVPDKGMVCVLEITDKQYGGITIYEGTPASVKKDKVKKIIKKPVQLEIF